MQSLSFAKSLRLSVYGVCSFLVLSIGVPAFAQTLTAPQGAAPTALPSGMRSPGASPAAMPGNPIQMIKNDAWIEPEGEQSEIQGHQVVTVTGTVMFSVDLLSSVQPTKLTFSLNSRLTETGGATFPASYLPEKDAATGYRWQATFDTTTIPNGVYVLGEQNDSARGAGSGAPFYVIVRNPTSFMNWIVDSLMLGEASNFIIGILVVFVLIGLAGALARKGMFPRTAISPLFPVVTLLVVTTLSLAFLFVVANYHSRGQVVLLPNQPLLFALFAAIIGTLAFMSTDIWIGKYEGLKTLTWSDIMRRNSLLALCALLFLYSSVTGYAEIGPRPTGFWLSVIFLIVSLCGIAVSSFKMLSSKKK